MASTNLRPESAFFQLPAHYGFKVEDTVRFQRDQRVDDDDKLIGSCNSSTPRAGAGSVLAAKICDALARHGYEDSIIRKVGGLVTSNMMTCASTQVGEEAGLETMPPRAEDDQMDMQRTIELMLRGLLDKSTPSSHTVNVNSNEPVLLVNGFDRIEKHRFAVLVHKTVQQLQKDWNVWPVRVYAGRYFPTSGDGFSVTLLNVVNTDIGGPSMVQLLDEHTDSSEWKQFLRREVWRDRDLVSVEEGHWVSGEDDDNVSDGGSVHSFQSNSSYAPESVLRLVIEKSPRAPHSPSLAAEDSDVGEAVLESPLGLDEKAVEDEMKGDSDVDSAFAAVEDEKSGSILEKREMSERNIVHPTWDRRHDSTSLIDLIRLQALDIPPLGVDEETRVESLDTAATEPTPSEPSKKDDDSFVLL
ncbi:uncharacterized protein A1O9_10827 [Exophiala aquamarina CBS 119918]|uniref:DhaK domain-containing protein n=1 Tax=Exophiala aquamarina CBS 119918 TaxID=1182545 RepID=A0A072NZ92_9EURO|nr:uncharacterized protein A1O9_10827 [Exophiala aquamarina CBS 119918]KEF52921.1 hypothetical protein A1O9_10827 [Exophiala aquamarina CBS 119918]